MFNKARGPLIVTGGNGEQRRPHTNGYFDDRSIFNKHRSLAREYSRGAREIMNDQFNYRDLFGFNSANYKPDELIVFALYNANYARPLEAQAATPP